jgi:hypothetical protein
MKECMYTQKNYMAVFLWITRATSSCYIGLKPVVDGDIDHFRTAEPPLSKTISLAQNITVKIFEVNITVTSDLK